MPGHFRPGTMLAAAAAALCVGSAQAEIIELSWDHDGRFERAASVAPGKFIEICGKLAKGAQVRWSFTSSAPGDFNIHYHVSKSEVVYPARSKAVREGQDTLIAPLEQDYCWMWSNKGEASLRLNARLERLAPR